MGVRDVIRFFKYKKEYPLANISLGAWVSQNSMIGADVSVGAKSVIMQSTLGESVNVQNSTEIINSHLERYITVSAYCRLAGTKVGAFSYIGSRSDIGHTNIGTFSSIASDVGIGNGIHPTNFVSTSPIFYSTVKLCGVAFAERNSYKDELPVYIGNDVWIGAKAFLRDGIKVGNGAIIGAGAVVVKDVPDYAIVAGVPAKVIRFRFEEDIVQDLLKLKWWDWPEKRLRSASHLFSQPDIRFFLQEVIKLQ